MNAQPPCGASRTSCMRWRWTFGRSKVVARKTKEGRPLPDNGTPLGKVLAHLDAKTLALLIAVLGSNGAWALKPEAPSIPVDQYTAVVTQLTIEKSDAVTAKDACQAVLLKKQTRGGRRP